MFTKLLLLAAVLVTAAVSLTGPQTTSAITPDIVVDHITIDPCIKGHATYYSIHEAVDAVVNPGTKIYVCPGAYTEPMLRMDVTSTTLYGPGATPEDDGIATITKDGSDIYSYMVYMTGDSQYFQGFTIDATPPVGFQSQLIAVQSEGDYNEIDDNIVQNDASAPAIYVGGQGPVVQRNEMTNDSGGIMCECDYGTFTDNIIHPTGMNLGIQAVGLGPNVQSNHLTGTGIRVDGPGAVIDYNDIDFSNNSDYAMIAAGDPLTITGNTIQNVNGVALQVSDPNSVGNTVATLSNNVFNNVQEAIYLHDDDTTDARTVTTTVSGAEANFNSFANVSGPMLTNLTKSDVNAEYNDWGLCSLAAIEEKVFHHPDDAQWGTVDYDPFIDPGNCPTPTTSATPTTTPAGVLKRGDVNCDGHVAPDDALELVVHASGIPVPHSGCPQIGGPAVVVGAGLIVWADEDCDGDADLDDGLVLLAYLADTPLSETCSPGANLGDVVPGP